MVSCVQEQVAQLTVNKVFSMSKNQSTIYRFLAVMFFMFSLAYSAMPYAVSAHYTDPATTTVLRVYALTPGQDNSLPQTSFVATVVGASAAPSSFLVTPSGTVVSVSAGQSYDVRMQPYDGYSASYSSGCAGTVSLRSEATCVITVTRSSYYTSTPIPYPYPHQEVSLRCLPGYQTAFMGKTVTFRAFGGAGTYTWNTGERAYYNTGSVLNTEFTQSGTKVVTVVSASQTATCTVTVLPTMGSVYPTISPNTPILSTVLVPALPNTGFAPINSVYFVLSLVLLMSLGLIVYPYVRKTINITFS